MSLPSGAREGRVGLVRETPGHFAFWCWLRKRGIERPTVDDCLRYSWVPAMWEAMTETSAVLLQLSGVGRNRRGMFYVRRNKR